MPNPNHARGARSRANLKRGGQPGRAKMTVEEKEVRRVSKKLVMDAEYRRNLLTRLKDGTLHPSVQVMLWYYAFGKPTEVIETKNPSPVRITHEYAPE